ncbi:MAG: hypothetical protein ACRDTX_31340 [Pseudonocardiaceae bacterium]
MSPRPLSGLRSGSHACLPPEVEGLLVDLVADGFVVHCCGPRTAPRALVASYQWDGYVDLATIRCFDRVTTARVPVPHGGRVDVFAPETVVWAYEGPPQQALRALLDLVHPHHPDAPTSAYPAPLVLHIPRAEQRPMTVRLPPPDLARTRATCVRHNPVHLPRPTGQVVPGVALSARPRTPLRGNLRMRDDWL